MKDNQEAKAKIYRKKIMDEVAQLEVIDDDHVYEIIENHIYKDMLYASIDEKEGMIEFLFNSIRRYHIIQPLLDDDSISEIMINGYDEIFIEQNGSIKKIPLVFDSKQELESLIQKMVSKMDRKVNEKDPICDVRLACGSRVNIVLNPIAIEGPCVTIRKFPSKRLTRDDIISNKTISLEAMTLLEKLVSKKFNIFVSGGTSSGKTTMLNILSDAIDKSERIITIEDSAELKIHNIENLIRLESRIFHDSYNQNVTIRDLIRSSLRMRPDRIIVGEVRGEETIDMLQCMNTGHDGSLSTGHGNSIYDMLLRLETMVLSGLDIPLNAIRQQIVSALDLMVHIQKIKGRGRRVVEIGELVGLKDNKVIINPLYTYDDASDQLLKTSNAIINKDKLLWN